MPRIAPTPDHSDHGITITAAGPMTQPRLHAQCLCGWRSPLTASRPAAREHGAAHLTEVTPPLREILDEVMANPDVRDALIGLNEGEQAEVRRAAAAAITVPKPPPCPPWCEAEHDGPGGWDLEPVTGVLSASKLCQHSVDFFKVEDGYVEIILDRLASVDVVGGKWDTTVSNAHVRLNVQGAMPLAKLSTAEGIAHAILTAVAAAGPS